MAAAAGCITIFVFALVLGVAACIVVDSNSLLLMNVLPELGIAANASVSEFLSDCFNSAGVGAPFNAGSIGRPAHWQAAASLYLLGPPVVRAVTPFLPRIYDAALNARHVAAAAISAAMFDLLRGSAHLALFLLLLSYFTVPTEQALFAASVGRQPGVLTIADSGAGIHAINNPCLAIPGTLRPNATAISTASGKCVPDHVCDAYIDTLATDGSLVRLMLADALIIPSCKHNLVSLGLLAESQKITSHIAAGGTSYMLLPDGRKVELLNRGVFVIPDAATSLINAIAEDEPAASCDRGLWTTLHNRFNGRSFDVLRNLVTCGLPVPREWSRALKRPPRHQCDSCLRSRADKLPSRSHVPPVKEPGYISYDIFKMGVPHMRGGQRYVIGFHDTYSTLNKVYLLSAKSHAPQAIEMYHAWARSHGVDIKRFHADNAPELTGPKVEAAWAARGVRVTACAPYEPRGNGQMERQWRTIGNDTRHLLAAANLPPGMWWYAMRASVNASWSIPINGAETPWSRYTGRPSSPFLHRTFGCLAYYRIRQPESKAHMRAARALHLGRAESQPGYSVLDLESRKILVTPHVRFVEDSFPGLAASPGGGEPSPDEIQRLFDRHPDADSNSESHHREASPPPATVHPPCTAESEIEPIESESAVGAGGDAADNINDLEDMTTRPNSEVSDESGRGGVPGNVQDGDDEGLEVQSEAAPDNTRISQRLSRIRTQRVLHDATFAAVVASEFAPAIEVPESKNGFYMYIGSGPHREGDLESELKRIGGLPMLSIDLKISGYDHDITHAAVQKRLLEIASYPACKGVFISIPCKTFSVLRSKQGVEHSYPLRNRKHVLGIPRADNTLPFKVTQSNLMSDFAAKLMRIVHDNGGAFAAESPPSRSANSRFPIEGREDHVSQFDYPAWAKLRREAGARMIYFDQCALHDDPALVPKKKTALMVNPKAHAAFHKRFAPLICTHDYNAHLQAYGIDSSGKFSSSITENYPTKMNTLIAEALVESCERAQKNSCNPRDTPSSATTPPLEVWQGYFDSDAARPAQTDINDSPKPTLLLESAASLLQSTRAFSNQLYYSGIDGQVFAAPREVSSDNPTYREARVSPEWPEWEKACEREIENLRRNGTIDEDKAIPEDSLPSWDPIKKRASQVVNILWLNSLGAAHQIQRRCIRQIQGTRGI